MNILNKRFKATDFVQLYPVKVFYVSTNQAILDIDQFQPNVYIHVPGSWKIKHFGGTLHGYTLYIVTPIGVSNE